MEKLNELVGGKIQQLVEVHPTEGKLAECAALGLFGVSLKQSDAITLGYRWLKRGSSYGAGKTTGMNDLEYSYYSINKSNACVENKRTMMNELMGRRLRRRPEKQERNHSTSSAVLHSRQPSTATDS